MDNEVWILGGTGRSGRVIATELMARGLPPVLVGRNPTRLAEAAQAAAQAMAANPTEATFDINNQPRTVVATSIDDMAAAIRRDRPPVVINTVGPFATTAEPIARACLAAGSHYIDLANDVAAVTTVLNLNDQAQHKNRTLITGAGFGVTATESVVVKLIQDQPHQDPQAPETVRVDMIPSLAVEEGPLGEALAATLVDGFPDAKGRARYQGRRYTNGRLTKTRLASDPVTLTLPDGSNVTTTAMPLGELVAAHRASGAPNVVSASSEIPSSPVVRVILPIATTLLTIGPVRAFARRRLAQVSLKPHDRPRPHSWAHARLEWADGRTAEGWLRLGDAGAFTGAVPAETALRLLNAPASSERRSGAFTPAALFGPSLAESCGAEYRPVGQEAAQESALPKLG
jgi:short subunit dehydrogenase-like uncharacterized protein